VTLFDYDYLINKKKLEEDDNLADFVTATTEFKEDALADANILTLKEGDIIQFERKGYYILDRFNKAENVAKFIKIPDGKVASLASKAGGAVPVESVPASAVPKTKTPGKGSWGKGGNPPGRATATTQVPEGTHIMLSEGTTGFEIPVKTTLHKVPRVFGENAVETPSNVSLHKVPNIYDSV
jgi:glutamyl-tRNA synthetase